MTPDRSRRSVLSLSAAALALPACAPAPSTDGPTWHQDLAPVARANCETCHRAGGIGPFSMESYEGAAPWASAMAAETAARRMPPWGALETEECSPPMPWKHDMRLTDAEIALFADWAAAGAPEGDPDSAAPLPESSSLDLADATATFAPDGGWVASGDHDQFRCFLVDPQFDDTRWLTGLQVLPGNDEVVHHVLVFSTGPDGVANAEALLEPGESSWDCFGGAGVDLGDDAALVGAWVPGALAMETPAGTGMKIDAGGQFVVQVHYHPAGRTHDEDTTGIALRWTEDAPGRRAIMALVGNFDEAPYLLPGENDEHGEPQFRIPAGESGHRETARFTLTEDIGELRVWAAGTHMHYVGVDMKITVYRGDEREADEAEEDCLVQTPDWDFDWQRWYEYDVDIEDAYVLRPGDSIEFRCTYDNTLDNEAVREALEERGLDAPADIYLGQGTLDEMCLGVFGVTY